MKRERNGRNLGALAGCLALACVMWASDVTTVLAEDNFVVGRGAGQPNPNQVRAFKADGTPTPTDFYAYGAGQWGVFVSAGNLNYAEPTSIVTGPGPGPVFGAQVRKFDRTGTPDPHMNFYAYGNLRYGCNVATGHVYAGNEIRTVITGAGEGQTFGPHVRGWKYDGSRTTADAGINFFAYMSCRWGVRVAAGNFSGYGLDGIGTTPGPGAVFAPNVRGWAPQGSQVKLVPGFDFWAFSDPNYGGTIAFAAAKENWKDDVVAGRGKGPSLAAQAKGYRYTPLSGISALPGLDVTAFGSHYGASVGGGYVDDPMGLDHVLVSPGPDAAGAAAVKSYRYDGAKVNLDLAFTAFPGAYGTNVSTGGLY